MKNSNKIVGLCAITTTLLVGACALFSKGNPQTLFVHASEPSIELIDRLANKTIVDGTVSYVANNYEYKFYASNVTFGTNEITIHDGGYLRNWTAFNTISSLDVAGELDNMILSSGVSSLVFDRYDICKRHEYIGTPGDIAGTTHFSIAAEGGDVTLTTLDLQYRDCTTNGVDTSDGVTYTHYTWLFRGLGTKDSPYLINNINDWNLFADLSKDFIFLDKYFKLTTDLTGVTKQIAPTSAKRFAGSFDGDYHTIEATLSSTDKTIALFSYITTEASISNLTLRGSVTCTSSNNALGCGGIVGNLFNINNRYAKLTNLVNYANITGNTQRASGILSYCNGRVTIKNCENRGNIKSSASLYVGGIIGTIISAPTGIADAFNMYEVSNYGTLSCSSNANARKGGILGYTGAGAYFINISHYEIGSYNVVGIDQVTANGGSIKITDLR